MSTDPQALFTRLRPLQEKKGYHFNKDREMTLDLLAGLLNNLDRYGYMSCPCRLASGNRSADRDIICPCDYRGPDVNEFGSCFCGLYVSKNWNQGRVPHLYVPERRPARRPPGQGA